MTLACARPLLFLGIDSSDYRRMRSSNTATTGDQFKFCFESRTVPYRTVGREWAAEFDF